MLIPTSVVADLFTQISGFSNHNTTSNGLNHQASFASTALITSLLWSFLFSGLAFAYNYLSGRVVRLFLVSLTVDRRYSSGDSFDVLVQWLRTQTIISPPQCVTAELIDDDSDDDDPDDDDDAKKKTIRYLPTKHTSMTILYRGRRIWIRRVPHEEGKRNFGLYNESLVLSCFATSTEPLKQLMSDANELRLRASAGHTRIRFCGDGGQWGEVLLRRSRPLSSVVLPSCGGTRLRDDVAEFLRSRQWYMDRGLPWRRGYLLYGPPGNGKSSFVFALAGELKLAVHVITLSNVTDKSLRELFDAVHGRAVVLLEDIDAAVVSSTAQRRAAAAAASSSSSSDQTQDQTTTSAVGGGGAASLLTLSGLLNAIDGVGASEGRVLFLTTNHRTLLDPALIRPGRVDVQVEFRNASREQIQQMFVRFYQDAAAAAPSAELLAQAVRFADRVPADAVSMAELQCHLLLHKLDPEAAIAGAASLASPVAATCTSEPSAVDRDGGVVAA